MIRTIHLTDGGEHIDLGDGWVIKRYEEDTWEMQQELPKGGHLPLCCVHLRIVQVLQECEAEIDAASKLLAVVLEESEVEIAAAREVLAVIHRDGGQHTERRGFVQSCKDAEVSVYKMLEVVDAAHTYWLHTQHSTDAMEAKGHLS